MEGNKAATFYERTRSDKKIKRARSHWRLFLFPCQPTMANTIWTDLCRQPTLKAPSEKYAQIVHDSTTQLHQSFVSILSALDRRAMALTKTASFESALHDANLIQQLSPSSALGYLREASIYSEQGKQLQVIRICNKGLNKVDANDKHYGTLKQLRRDAEQHHNTRIDFIKQLPTDIVITTLIPMFMDDFRMSSTAPSLYLYVSNLWRNRIIQCFGGLRFTIGNTEDHDLSCVLELSRYIKILDVERHSKITQVSGLLCNNNFCSLTELSIYCKLRPLFDVLLFTFVSIRGHASTLWTLGFVI